MYTNKAIVIRNANIVAGRTNVECFGDQLEKYLHMKDMSQAKFVAMVHAVAQESGERFTMSDMHNYLYGPRGKTTRVNPKANKLAAVIKATGMPYEYWTGAISYATADAMRRAGIVR